MLRRALLTGCLSILMSVQAWAFDRPFPPVAKRGTMSPAAYPEIVIDGTMRRLSPGARIWNQNTLIVVPASVRGNDLIVNYTEDAQQQLDRVWILTADEVRRPLRSQTQKPPQ
jgi:hypothetical protein